MVLSISEAAIDGQNFPLKFYRPIKVSGFPGRPMHALVLLASLKNSHYAFSRKKELHRPSNDISAYKYVRLETPKQEITSLPRFFMQDGETFF